MPSNRTTIQPATLVVAAVATLFWVGVSLGVAGVVELSASVTAVRIGVPVLALLFAYYVLFHEGDRRGARLLATLLLVTGLAGFVAIVLAQPTVTFVANVLTLLGMFGMVAFLWR